MEFREITAADVPALFVVRVATDENQLTREQLESLGITEDAVERKLRGSYRGWLCEASGHVVGFAMGDCATGELWVIAVLPAFIGRGIGSELLRKVEECLHSTGCGNLWLATDPDTRLRAYTFYRRRGWEDQGVRDGVRYMRKIREPIQALDPTRVSRPAIGKPPED